VELFTGPYNDGENMGTMYVNSLDVTCLGKNNNAICYLDSPYNPSYFYRINPHSHKPKTKGSSSFSESLINGSY